MYLKDKKNGDLIEVLDMAALIDPFQTAFEGRPHAGEELQEPRRYEKAEMVFPSDEPLPRCWIDPHYRS